MSDKELRAKRGSRPHTYVPEHTHALLNLIECVIASGGVAL